MPWVLGVGGEDGAQYVTTQVPSIITTRENLPLMYFRLVGHIVFNVTFHSRSDSKHQQYLFFTRHKKVVNLPVGNLHALFTNTENYR